MKTELAIIGGGPTGSLAAEKAAENNCEVTVFDQRSPIGIPDHCAGLLSVTGLKSLGLADLPSSIFQNTKIKGAIFHSPTGKEFRVEKKSPQAVVVSRALFDQYLVTRAEKRGAKILRGRKVTNISFDKRTETLEIDFVEKNSKERVEKNNSLKAFLGIIAEGRSARLTKKLGFPSNGKEFRLPGMQYLVEKVHDLEKEFVEIFVSNKIAPGFFAWIIPISSSLAKVGLASKGYTAARLRYFLNRYSLTKARFQNSKILKSYGGEVLVGGPITRTTKNGLMVIGDAAGQTKATTGGGVITGGIAGILAGEIASQAINKGDNSREFIKRYDQEWRKRLEFQLKTMVYFRKLANRLSDKALDRAFETVIKNGLEEIISAQGDIDNQVKVIRSLVFNPAIIKLGLKLLPELLLNTPEVEIV
ncbi:MAG: geranylgeranyl reductase family protein [Candidatus Heimdallarchaeota archaeon]|nr:geranylgeranyl reductase family protein [Candidatus Heimdallarchaeota archaeon]